MRFHARARQKKNEAGMNKTEARYAEQLYFEQVSGEILRYDFQPERLRLADNTFYVPDFRVIAKDGTVEFHEVKGFWEDDARVKIKVAAEMHPYKFIACKYNKKTGWSFEEF